GYSVKVGAFARSLQTSAQPLQIVTDSRAEMLDNFVVSVVPRYTTMKLLVSSLLLSVTFAQSPDDPRIVTFNQADAEHCKVIMVSGKPMLATSYEGTTVAITMPQNWENGEFSVFIAVAQVGPGEADVNPKAISALYPDPTHTRFHWFDKAHDLDTLASMHAAGLDQSGGAPPGGPGMPGRPPESGSVTESNSASPPPNHPEAMGPIDPHAATRSEEEGRLFQLRNQAGKGSSLPQIDPAHPPVFLRITAVRQGSRASGYVFLRKPKGSKVEVSPSTMLEEIDIPINGVIFRF
ncbi:MAG: hypothetical protein ABSE96_21285, partial [Terracidiphilus sp.]